MYCNGSDGVRKFISEFLVEGVVWGVVLLVMFCCVEDSR